MISSCNTIVDRRDHVQYLTVSKSYSDNCTCSLTEQNIVRHFFLECGDFAQVRNKCFHVDNMKELFQDIHIVSIMTFLRQINLFNKN